MHSKSSWKKLGSVLVGVLVALFLGAVGVEEASARESSKAPQDGERKAVPRSPGGNRGQSGGEVRSQPRGPERRPSAHRDRRSDSRHRGHHSGSYHGSYGGHYRFGLSYYGYLPWYLRYGPYGHYYGGYGYGHYSYPHYGGPTYVAAALGAVDLNVKPKKADVYLDGELIGSAGEFDGFPGYLWLEKGEHQLVFHREGFETVVREVKVLPGVVVDLRERMVVGESLSPDAFPPPARPTEAVAQAPARDARPAVGPPLTEIDATSEPGRLMVRVEPGDASVYLDGRFLGTGDDLSRLQSGVMVDPGAHVLEIVRPGFATETREVDVESGTESELLVTLDRNVA